MPANNLAESESKASGTSRRPASAATYHLGTWILIACSAALAAIGIAMVGLTRSARDGADGTEILQVPLLLPQVILTLLIAGTLIGQSFNRTMPSGVRVLRRVIALVGLSSLFWPYLV